MIEKQARVVTVDGDVAVIVTEQQSACGSCAAKTGCGTSLLSAWFPKRRVTLHLRNDIGAKCGDTVVVGLDEGLLQRSSLLLYALPLAGLLLGAIAGERGFLLLELPAELGAVATGLLGVTGALLYARHVAAGRMRSGLAGIQLLRVHQRSESVALGDIGVSNVHQL